VRLAALAAALLHGTLHGQDAASGQSAGIQVLDEPTVRAVRTGQPPTIDGILDEPFWHEIEPVTDFRQRVPVDGAPSSERTELRVAFDDNNLYFAVVLHDSDPDRGFGAASCTARDGSIRTTTSASASTRTTTSATPTSSRSTHSAPRATRSSPTSR